MSVCSKKLSKFTHGHDFKRAQNYVAKRYMEDVERDVYFEDVKLQMDAKLWGEEYNRHNPPKKVGQQRAGDLGQGDLAQSNGSSKTGAVLGHCCVCSDDSGCKVVQSPSCQSRPDKIRNKYLWV